MRCWCANIPGGWSQIKEATAHAGMETPAKNARESAQAKLQAGAARHKPKAAVRGCGEDSNGGAKET